MPTASASRCRGVVEAWTASITPVLPSTNPLSERNTRTIHGLVESAQPLHTVYDPGSSFADDKGYVQMPNVNPVDEMVNMISAQQDYQANLETFNVAKTLAMRTLTI